MRLALSGLFRPFLLLFPFCLPRLARFRILLALPRARAMIRFTVGPSPTIASFTTNPSGFRFALFSALAIALFNVLPMRSAAFFGVKASRSSAAETGRPWISRVTSRALNGEIRAYLYVDLTSIFLTSNLHRIAHPPGGDLLLLFVLSLNPFPESRPHKSFVAHRLLAVSQSFDHLASPALAFQSLRPVSRRDCRPQTTIRLSH